MTAALLRPMAIAPMLLSIAACADNVPTSPPTPLAARVTSAATRDDLRAWLTTFIGSSSSPMAGEPSVLAGAGDIARCYPGPNFREFQPPGPDHPAELTAKLLDAMPRATVMAVGDLAYEFGSPFDFLGVLRSDLGTS